MIEHEQFIVLLRERFPDVADSVDEGIVGLLHLEVAALGRAAIDAIREGDRRVVAEHFAFVDELYRHGDADLQDAIPVSYLELIDFKGRKARSMKARELLTQPLLEAVEALEKFWEGRR